MRLHVLYAWNNKREETRFLLLSYDVVHPRPPPLLASNSYLCTYDLCSVHNVLDAGIYFTWAFPGPKPLSLAQVYTCSISKREEKGELYVAVSAVWRGRQDPNKMTAKKIWHLPSWMSSVLCSAEVPVLFSLCQFITWP